METPLDTTSTPVTTSPAPAAPVTTSPAPAAPAAASPSAPAPANAPAGAAGQTSPTPPQSVTAGAGAATTTPASAAATAFQLRDFARQNGIDLSQMQDDPAAARALLQSYLQLQQPQTRELLRMGQQAQAHWADFQQFLAQRQAGTLPQGPAAQQPKQGGWKAPAYDPGWVHQIRRDPTTGELVPTNGGTMETVRQYTEWKAHFDRTQTEFATDPKKFLEGAGLQDMIDQRVQQIVNDRLGQQQGNQYVQQFEQQHGHWLYARGDNGQVMTGLDGSPLFSPWGQRFLQHANYAGQIGINTSEAKADYALKMIKYEFQQQGGQQQAAAPPAPAAPAAAQPTPQEAANAAFLNQARQPAPGAARQPNSGAAPAAAPTGTRKLSLAERLKASFAQAGVTDEQVNATFNGRR